MIFQVNAIAGIDIIWVSGSGMNTAGGFTAQEIDNEIAYNGITSIMETHRTLYNKWLTDCKVTTDVGGQAETSQQQALITRAFKLICYYAYSKDGFLQDLANGKCDCDCETKKRQFLRTLSEDVICKSITIACVKTKYLDWLHGICDKQGALLDFFGSDVITHECKPNRIVRWADDCGCCGG